MMRSRIIWAILLSTCAMVRAMSADFTPLPTLARVMALPQPKPIADFTLSNQLGSSLSFSSLQGKPTLVFFGFTHCPDICPAALHQLAMLKKADPERMRDVNVVMISVDGERDTPDALKAYLSNFSAEFIGMTGSPDVLREVASRFTAVFFKDSPKKGTGAYLVQHTSRVYALDVKGRLRAELYDASMETTAAVIGALLKE
jgi:protein SCO1/2